MYDNMLYYITKYDNFVYFIIIYQYYNQNISIGMLLPCLLVAVLSSGITKANGLSVYDQGIVLVLVFCFNFFILLLY